MQYVYFKHLKVSNFLSIGKKPVEITFAPGINVITGKNYDKVDRANGVGKSTITDAIFFALYGNTLRELKKENIVNDQAPDSLCEVELNFSCVSGDQTRECKIIRSINPTKCYFYVDNVDVTRSGMPQTTELIIDTIRTSPEVFQNSVIMSVNNTVPFMAQKKIEKRKFIEGILGLEVFSNMLQLAREDANETKKTLEVESTKLEEILRNLQDTTNQKEAWENTKNKKLVDLQTKSANNEREIAVIEKKIDSIDILDPKIYQKLNNDIKESAEKISKLKDKLEDNKSKVAIAESHIKKDKRDSQELKKPIKKITNSEDELQQTVKDLESQLLNLGQLDSNELTTIKDELDSFKAAIDTIDKKIKEANKTIAIAEGKISVCNDALKNLKKPDKSCPHCGKNIEEVGVIHYETNKKNTEDELLEHQNLLAKTKTSLDKLTSKRVEIEDSIKDLDKKNNDYYIKSKNITSLEQKLQQAKFSLQSFKLELESFEKETEKYNKTLNELSSNILENEKIIIEKSKLIESIQSDIDVTNKDYESLIKKFDDFKIKKQEIESLNQRKVDLIYWQKEVSKDIESLNNESNRYEDIIKSINKRIDTSKQLIVDLQERADIIESAKFIASEDGVKSYIVKKILQVLNNRLLYYLKKLESNCIVRFNEIFDEIIINERNKECSYFNFSGAERKAIDLAMLFTFQDIRRAQAAVGINLVMFDELLDSSLDEKGIDLVLDILKERVNSYNEAIYIISHRKECRKYCASGEMIFLEKRNGITTRTTNYELS
jgi:DNA repair protein SbcC/Rad50